MKKTKNSYKKSGVNIELANSFVKHIETISNKNDKKKNSSKNPGNMVLLVLFLTLVRSKLKIP